MAVPMTETTTQTVETSKGDGVDKVTATSKPTDKSAVGVDVDKDSERASERASVQQVSFEPQATETHQQHPTCHPHQVLQATVQLISSSRGRQRLRRRRKRRRRRRRAVEGTDVRR